ncbi:hypothetical protein F5Y19DRAFT_477394 [Xylariaceae sp. FL1651]|nr:hypothetical protein F5Y19DRAFT_477394 [Xylariaceae sp. FL1651]
MDCTESAVARMPAISILDNVAADLLIFPQASINAQPLSVEISTELGTGIAARALQAAAGVLRANVQHIQDQGIIASKKSGLIRQLQERRQQANQASREIKLVDQQILAQKTFVERLELYTWLENQYGAVYQDTYTTASQLAQKVQKAYHFKQPGDNTAYLNPVVGGYRDSSRDGLLSGARLSLDLKRVEMAYLNNQPYDFEIEKNISLRQLHPLGLLALRATGTVEFNLPETLFDMDFPGHHSRRIMSVSLHMPCVVGSCVSLNCTLTLKSNTYRIRKDAMDGDDYRNIEKEGVFRTDVIPITCIAVTSNQHDSGKFNFGSSPDKYLPFEGVVRLPERLGRGHAGTLYLGQRRPEVEDGCNRCATEGLQDATIGSNNSLPSAIVDARCDSTGNWFAFAEKTKQGKATEGSLTLSGLNRYLPFWARGFTKAKVYRVSLIVMPAMAPAQFDLQKYLVLTGPSGGVSWKSATNLGDCCVVLQSDDGNQDL